MLSPSIHQNHSYFDGIDINFLLFRASLVTLMVKNLPAMQEIRVQFLGQEDPLDKEIETHSSILAW